MGRGAKVFLAAAIIAAAAIAAAKLYYAGKAPVTLPSAECDANLWNHVYDKQRLHVIADCTAVEGRVRSIRHVPDGDLHIALEPDQKSVLNLVNVMHAHRTLVVESVCEHTPEEASARAACGDFHPGITAPSVGDRVRITGAYVTDVDNGWNEIHPVSQIEVLR